jgi:hypothetical protein
MPFGVMKNRGNMSAVIDGLQKEHGLLAAYLEATDKIGWRALHKPMAITETPKPVGLEAHQVSAAQQLPEVVPPTSPFVLRRANLVLIWSRTWISENGEPSGTAPSHSLVCAPQVEMVQRAAVRFPPLARLTAFMDGAARRLETATAPVQRQRKFAVFVVACLVVASFAGTYFHDGITAVLAQYPAHSDMLLGFLAGLARHITGRGADVSGSSSKSGAFDSLRPGDRARQARLGRQAMEGTLAARLAERRIAELQPGARRDPTHGPRPSSSVRLPSELAGASLQMDSQEALRAARTATATIPIVALDLETDPVKAGFVGSDLEGLLFRIRWGRLPRPRRSRSRPTVCHQAP